MKYALFTAVICVFIILFLMSNPFEGDAMRIVSALSLPFFGMIGLGILLFKT